MRRPKRADEANGIYDALNRGNARSAIFKKDTEYNAFERILAEGLERYACRILTKLSVDAQSLAYCVAANGRWWYE